jgi:hypothetical protein
MYRTSRNQERRIMTQSGAIEFRIVGRSFRRRETTERIVWTGRLSEPDDAPGSLR